MYLVNKGLIIMADTGASFNRPYKPFGMNVKVPEIG